MVKQKLNKTKKKVQKNYLERKDNARKVIENIIKEKQEKELGNRLDVNYKSTGSVLIEE